MAFVSKGTVADEQQQDEESGEGDEGDDGDDGAGAGLGYAAGAGLGYQAPPKRQQKQQQQQQQTRQQQQQHAKVSHDFGKFERHTKGIGSKILAKFGYKPVRTFRLSLNSVAVSPALRMSLWLSRFFYAAYACVLLFRCPGADLYFLRALFFLQSVQGQGLGKEGRGLAEPIAVQVRPKGAALGSIREATHSKENEPVAEVRPLLTRPFC
jgi:hypothetical protein